MSVFYVYDPWVWWCLNDNINIWYTNCIIVCNFVSVEKCLLCFECVNVFFYGIRCTNHGLYFPSVCCPLSVVMLGITYILWNMFWVFWCEIVGWILNIFIVFWVCILLRTMIVSYSFDGRSFVCPSHECVSVRNNIYIMKYVLSVLAWHFLINICIRFWVCIFFTDHDFIIVICLSLK